MKLLSLQHFRPVLLSALAFLLFMGRAHADEVDPLCDPITGCKPAIARITYNGRDALRLTDGRAEAVVVPSLGRVMHYSLIGGQNFLWNNSRKSFKDKEWKNWGGDKTWPAPQSQWSMMTGQNWPPDAAWDSSPHAEEVLTGGHLRLTSPVSSGLGARVVREFYFDTNGDFVIAQTVEKLRGAPLDLSIWSVTQITPPDAVFLPLNPNSAYKNNYYWITAPKDDPVVHSSPALLQVRPTLSGAYKIGVDAPVAAIAAVKDRTAFVQRANRPDKASYPDGALGSGFPLELYNTGRTSEDYMEMEMLSPLLSFKTGSKWQHTVRWSLRELTSNDVNSPTLRAEVEALLQEPIKTVQSA
jgi:hypothetical protein